jgi:hypothetical protein
MVWSSDAMTQLGAQTGGLPPRPAERSGLRRHAVADGRCDWTSRSRQPASRRSTVTGSRSTSGLRTMTAATLSRLRRAAQSPEAATPFAQPGGSSLPEVDRPCACSETAPAISGSGNASAPYRSIPWRRGALSCALRTAATILFIHITIKQAVDEGAKRRQQIAPAGIVEIQARYRG